MSLVKNRPLLLSLALCAIVFLGGCNVEIPAVDNGSVTRYAAGKVAKGELSSTQVALPLASTTRKAV